MKSLDKSFVQERRWLEEWSEQQELCMFRFNAKAECINIEQSRIQINEPGKLCIPS